MREMEIKIYYKTSWHGYEVSDYKEKKKNLKKQKSPSADALLMQWVSLLLVMV